MTPESGKDVQKMADYDVIIVGAGPGGIFTAYELAKADKGLKVAVFVFAPARAARALCRSDS